MRALRCNFDTCHHFVFSFFFLSFFLSFLFFLSLLWWQACSRDQVDCVLLLLMRDANINAADTDGNTPLHICTLHGHERCAKVIVWHAPHMVLQRLFSSSLL